MPKRSLLAFAITAVAIAAACSDGGSTTPDPGDGTGPSIKAVIGANQKDTIEAQLRYALLAEVHGTTGKVLEGATVRFEVLLTTDSTRRAENTAYVCKTSIPICDGSFNYGQVVFDTTDKHGYAGTFVRLGTIPGIARIVASVPALHLTDTASFTVLPGAITRIALRVRDSSAYVGGSYRFGPVGYDRIGNLIELGTPTSTIVGSAATIENNDTFRAISIGRAGAAVHLDSFTDTAWITVPPRGTLAVFDAGRPSGVAKVELDGSGYRLIGPTEDTYYGTFPSWTSTGNVVFESGRVYAERMYVADTLGNKERLTSSTTVTHGEIFSDGSPDGWIYFSAGGSPLDYGTGIWRVKTPGSDPERVGPNPSGNANAWKVSASPDGTQLVYSDVTRGGVTVLDVLTGTPRAIVPQADMPRWSPLGDWILFNANGMLNRIRPDGTAKALIEPDRFYDPGADWSPDGAWIIARGHTQLELINLATGQTLPLGWSSRFIRPAWKP